MRNLFITMTAALVLTGCGESSTSKNEATQVTENISGQSGSADPYLTKISDVDFLDVKATNELSQRLSPSDTYAFTLYVIAWKASKISGDESKIRDSSGALPVTVRDAVAIQQAELRK